MFGFSYGQEDDVYQHWGDKEKSTSALNREEKAKGLFDALRDDIEKNPGDQTDDNNL